MTEFSLSLEDLCAATSGGVTRRHAQAFSGVTIDGRAVRPGDLYVAIVGERFDGHDFCSQAVAAGATGLVVARGRSPDFHVTCLEVDDLRAALGEVGRLVRRRSHVRVIGVTGSAGKTTTKEIISAMLRGAAGSEAVLATEGSLNNETGLPLTLLRLREPHRFAVVEMGMRGLGQIDALARFAEPDVAVITNVGTAHVGVVGSVDAIARGKSEIWSHLRSPGAAVFPHADERLWRFAKERCPGARHVTFGAHPDAGVSIRTVIPAGAKGSDVVFHLQGGGERRGLVPLVGRHNVDNAACALAVALALGIDLDRALDGIAHARPAKQRSELVEVGGRHVLLDCYNANPASMRAALETLCELKGDARAVCVLGDMLELGDSEIAEHARVGSALGPLGVTHLVALGERGRHIARAACKVGVPHVIETDEPELAARATWSWTSPGDWILVKASRGMRLERVVEALEKLA